jgi:sugar phosphate isomerase/epimerase
VITGPKDRLFALQLYTVRRELEAAPEKTVERVRSLGIQAVEIAPLPDGLTSRRLGQLLREFGLTVVAIHCDLPFGPGAAHAEALAESFDCRRVIWHGWPRDPGFDSLADLDHLIDRYSQAANTARSVGLELGLHNHWWEFEPISGHLPYRRMFEQLDPSVFFELDVYWVRTAGSEPSEIVRELSTRVKMLHLKDGPAQQGQPMTALGDGMIDIRAILNNLPPGVDSLVLEMDECASDVWTAIERSVDYIKALSSPERFATRLAAD